MDALNDHNNGLETRKQNLFSTGLSAILSILLCVVGFDTTTKEKRIDAGVDLGGEGRDNEQQESDGFFADDEPTAKFMATSIFLVFAKAGYERIPSLKESHYLRQSSWQRGQWVPLPPIV